MSEEQGTKEQTENKKTDLFQGATTQHSMNLNGTSITYTASADWMELRKEDKPVARMFHIAYCKDDEETSKRPVTFIFNGGPGAASAYLHVGALGPLRAAFSPDGDPLPPPVQLVENSESWLEFTDLVFVDPIGTGFSRLIEEEGKDSKETKSGASFQEFWEVKRDLESFGQLIQGFLSKHKRWTSPVFIAGESYGGFRVAKLVRMLQEGFGIGLNGALLISPAIELSTLVGTDYDVLHWCDSFPSMAASAYFHKKAKATLLELELVEFLEKAEVFVREKMLPMLLLGEAMPVEQREAIYEEMSSWMGLPASVIAEQKGRINIDKFRRSLLKEDGWVCGLHDATLTGMNPFKNRDTFEGPDPALFATERVFTSGINAMLREKLDVNPSLDYLLLNMKANLTWDDKTRKHFVQQTVGAMDELRYGMALNPHMKVMITHGYQDLVTPYFSSARLAGHMSLPPQLEKNLSLLNYHGGHMYYVWEESRKAFFNDAKEFFAEAVPQRD